MAKMSTQTGLPWHVVEEAINRETDWLRKVIVQNAVEKIPGCDECQHTFRKIALLIITGKVKAKEFTAKNGHDLWDGLTQKHSIAKSAWHGGDWHRKMMDVITAYFEREGFEVIPEPYISKGRADLGIYKDGYMDLFIEIGTTSVYKLWWNLHMLTDCKILLVPDENRAIEFTCHDAHGDRLHRP
ncbi:MAG: hypothetical protein MUO89_03640 [Dehalococcoidia bacterium]|nr:hypothetical protein [Dehalococcoidia bacterium]